VPLLRAGLRCAESVERRKVSRPPARRALSSFKSPGPAIRSVIDAPPGRAGPPGGNLKGQPQAAPPLPPAWATGRGKATQADSTAPQGAGAALFLQGSRTAFDPGDLRSRPTCFPAPTGLRVRCCKAQVLRPRSWLAACSAAQASALRPARLRLQRQQAVVGPADACCPCAQFGRPVPGSLCCCWRRARFVEFAACSRAAADAGLQGLTAAGRAVVPLRASCRAVGQSRRGQGGGRAPNGRFGAWSRTCSACSSLGLRHRWRPFCCCPAQCSPCLDRQSGPRCSCSCSPSC